MTGKEAKEISDDIMRFCTQIIEGEERSAFFRMGRLFERLEQIVAIDKCSFNPTVSKKEIDEV